MKNLPWLLFSLALALAVVVDILFFKVSSLGINVLILELIFLALSILIAKVVKHKIPVKAFVAAGFALAYSVTFAIWTSELGLTLSVFGWLAANTFWTLFLFGHPGHFHHPLQIVTDSISKFAEAFFTRITIIGHLKIPLFNRRSSSVARGVLIALPILIIFLLLFISSDLILQQRTNNFFDWLNDFMSAGNIFGHIFIIVSCTLIFLIIFATAFWKRLEFSSLKELSQRYNIESAVILVSSTVLFLGFVLFQAFYLFGGQAAWDSIEGITYSEYAVRGFGELSAVIILVLGLILSLRYFHSEKPRKLVTIFESILLGETVFIIVSAWIRMQLYVQTYGFTPARLFGFWFYIVAAVTIGLMLANILRHSKQIHFINQALIFTGAAMLIFTMAAPDALSVRLNMARASQEHPIKPFPLFDQLSAEAYPLMKDVIDNQKIAGLIQPQPKIEDYCAWRNTETKQYGLATGEQLDEKTLIGNDFYTRESINNWNHKWENYWFQQVCSCDGTKFSNHNEVFCENKEAECKWIVKSQWQAWNYSRSQVPAGSVYAKYTDLWNEITEACPIQIE